MALGELVAAGKVRHVGCSNMAPWRIERARQLARAPGLATYCCVQQRHSYLRPKPGADLSP
jgi:aryl-alcohol dehydrogenase-like predicted oxidoreductase